MGILNTFPPPVGPSLAFASKEGPQEADKTTIVDLTSSALYDVINVCTPHTLNNIFDDMAVEAAPPAPALVVRAVTAPATPLASTGGSASSTVVLSLLNPNAPEFHPGELDYSLHGRWTSHMSLSTHESKKSKRD